jgi:hypothetical protein
MKKYIKLKITDFILIAFELILCGILINLVLFNDFPMVSGFLLILFILISVILIIYLSYRESQSVKNE